MESNQNQTLRRGAVLSYGLIVMRQTFKAGAGILILLMVGCGTSKATWLPWVKKPKLAALPTVAAKTKEQPKTKVPPPPAKTKPISSAIPVEPAATRNSVAQFNLAFDLEAGGNLKAAVPLYQKAAEQNLAEAQYTVGYMYAHGDGLLKNDAKAFLWFRKAAEQGLPEAQQMMGIFYEQGRGVLLDFEQAANWFHKAAEQNYAHAQYHLGYLHVDGRMGVPMSYTKAAEWFRKAAENGVVDAQYQIGYYLARGVGVDQNMVEAYKWLSIASLNEHMGAKKARAELAEKISSDARKDGQTLANEFMSSQRPKP
jgi:ferritin